MLTNMDSVLLGLVGAALLTAALAPDVIRKLDFLALIGIKQKCSAWTRTAAGKWAPLAAVAVLLLLVLIAMGGPEARLFFMVLDAIGFDVLVAIVALQLRHMGATACALICVPLSSIRRRYIWTPGLGPHPAIL